MSTSAAVSGGGDLPVEIPKVCHTPHSAFQLSNGLRVIVIEDLTATRSAVAMAVGVGCNHDLPELPGLAHFCEHMLFLGTKVNPGEGEYHKWVQEHGGHSNAWTEDGATVFFFDAKTDSVESEGLHLFLHFFVCPLFSESGLEREVQAVHSEDEKNHSVDFWCQQELIKLHMANPQHPFGRYGNGNRHTLWDQPRSKGIDVREALLRFYKTYYVGSNMTLAIYSPLSKERVRELVEPILSQIPTGVPAQNGKPDLKPFTLEQSGGIWINQKGNTSSYELSLAFPIPFGDSDVAQQPSRFASYVLGHECKGSLLDVLRTRNFARAVAAGVGRNVDAHHSLFGIAIKLSAEGLANVDVVLELVFKSIAFLRDVIGENDTLISEMIDCAELSFQFSDIREQTNHTAKMARNGQLYGVTHAWPYASGVVRAFSRKDLANVMDSLSPRNCFVILKVPDVDLVVGGKGETTPQLPVDRFPVCGVHATETSEHHSVLFGKARIPQEVLTHWSFTDVPHQELAAPGFSIPKPNPYVTQSFDISPLSKDSPVPVEHPSTSSTHCMFRYKLDDKFGTPKGSLRILLQSPQAYRHARSHFFTTIATTLIEHRLTELLYYATVASLSCRVMPTIHGWMLVVSGPREHLTRVTSDILSEALSMSSEPTLELYKVYAERLIQNLISTRVAQPYNQVSELARASIQAVHWSSEDLLKAACGDATLSLEETLAALPHFDDFRDFTRGFWSEGIHYDALLLLNGKEADVDAHCQQLQSVLLERFTLCSEEELPRARDLLELPRRDTHSPLPPSTAPSGSTPLATMDGKPAVFSTASIRTSLNPNDPNCAVIITVQLGVRSARVEALTTTLSALLSAPFFDKLRTCETLGYVVHAGEWLVHSGAHLRFLAQSDTRSTLYTLSRILAFLHAIPSILSRVTASEFEDVRQAQIALRKDTPKSLGAEAAFWWDQRYHPEGFEHRKAEIHFLEQLQLDELRQFADEHLSLSSGAARVHTSLFVPDGDDSLQQVFATVEE